jgi:hypothetical protein
MIVKPKSSGEFTFKIKLAGDKNLEFYEGQVTFSHYEVQMSILLKKLL